MSLFQPDRLVGRSSEESILLNAYFSSLCVSHDSPASSILIHGESGLGKTKLAETLRSHVVEDDGYFIQGKFDQLSYTSAKRPYSIIASAFAEYCSAVEQRDEDTRLELVTKLRREIQREDRTILFEAIPALRGIIGDGPEAETKAFCNVESNSRAHRLNYSIRKFASVISSRTSSSGPIVLLLDDMQWASKEELDLLHQIVVGVHNPFIFMFTCRPIQDDNDPFYSFVKRCFPCYTEIQLRSLSQASVGDLVSATVGRSTEDCAALTSCIQNITGGNPFFICQQIIQFCDKGLLRFEEVWSWDDLDIMKESGMPNTDVINILYKKIKRLPLLTQEVLKICACIGSKIQLYILGLLIRMTRPAEEFDNVENEILAKNVISVAVREGMIVLSEGEIQFSHDSFAEAAYSLLKTEDRCSFHLNLGEILAEHISKDLFQKYLFTVAVQLAQGVDLIQEKGRITSVRIFVDAGDKSNLASAYLAAMSWFSFGISLLREQDWQQHYRLCTDVYLKAADASSAAREYDNMSSWLAIIFDRCKDSLVDLLTAYFIRVRTLAADEDPRAIGVGLEALRLVGIRFPSKNMTLHTLVRLAQARHLMTSKGGVDKLTELPSIIDEAYFIVLRLLNMLILLSLEWNQNLSPLLIACVIRLNMTYGMTPQMPSAVALYGSVMNRFGLTKEAFRYGEAALSLQETVGTNDTCAHVTLINHISSFLLVKKLSDCLKTLRMGWDSGLKTGDTAHAMSCAQLYCWVGLLSGQSLRKVSRSLVESSKSMKEHSSTSTLHAIEFHQQAVSDLLGDPAYSHKSNGCSCTHGEENSRVRNFQSKLDKLIVSVFLNNNKLAWEISETQSRPKAFKGSLWHYIYLFYRGVSAFALLRSTATRQIRTAAKRCVKDLRKGKKKSPFNLSHQSYILEAEYAFSRRKYHDAERFYTKAIEHAKGITHEHALACERFGCYYIFMNLHSKAYEQIREAYRLYSAWGSRPKCDSLTKKYPDLNDANDVSTSEEKNRCHA